VIGLDTNVIVRYVTQDDPAQSAAATKLMESLSAETPGFVPLVVAVELVWVLQSCYDAKPNAVTQVLETLLRSKELVVEQAELVWQALRGFSASHADFADCLIERCAQAAECQYTATFDKNAVAAGMRLIA
jgi:predicted nucleic-acid-binding protein